MKKTLAALTPVFLFIWLFVFAPLPMGEGMGVRAFASVRPAMVAGSFYPADKAELQFQINKFLANVPQLRSEEDIVALIVPHAGYPFSGQTAAYAYKLLSGRNYDRVILISVSHKLTFDEVAAADYDELATPLGSVPVDKDFIRALTKLSGRIRVNNEPFARDDNTLEVQLPFLQTVLKDFKVVPLLFGNVSLANCQALAYALNYLVDDRTLIVVSTDWSHYYPDQLARKLDRYGLQSVVAGSLEAFIAGLARGETEACGAPAVITALLLAPALGGDRVELLRYTNSGGVTGDQKNVVGYAAVVFYRRETTLTADERHKLLKIARRTLASKLAGKKLPVFTPPEESLNERRGVFVTLTEGGKLRGCIGYIQPVKPLFEAVQEMAVNAALNDRRFSPVAVDELGGIKIEVSVLSRLKRVNEVSEIEVGRDGLYIIKGDFAGLLLPQVAVEWGWDRDQFLKQVCGKAGLPEDAWRDSDALLYRFSAEVFHE
jgi:AmmeMemoRadiSam system protein B/AmmeMemoRadiSam system protein A